MEFLNENFDEWNDRRGTIEWLLPFPRFTHLDFSIWVILKNEVYSVKICDLDHLKE